MDKPLLEEEVEEIVYARNSSNKGKPLNEVVLFGKIKLPVLITVIVAIIVLLFFARTVRAFYIGFKYYDLRFANNNSAEVVNNNE